MIIFRSLMVFCSVTLVLIAVLTVAIGNVRSSLSDLGAPDSQSLRIAVCNLFAGARESTQVVSLLSTIEADVICLLEWTGHNLDVRSMQEKGFDVVVGHQGTGTHGVCVLARDGLDVDSEMASSRVTRNCRFPIATLRVRTDGGPVSVLVVHAPPPGQMCGPDNGRALDELRSWISDGRLRAAVGVARTGDPVIVAGDLNAVPFSRDVRALSGVGLRDAWSALHARPAFTWAPRPGLPKVARIDYILVGGALRIQESWVLNAPGSDHALVMADVRM